MPATVAQSAGVDISKGMLDVHLHPEGTARRVTNNAQGFTTLIAGLGERRIERVVFEPTGAYHHNFERRLGQTDMPLLKVNPLQARRFAQAIGQRAKTDAVEPPCSRASARSYSGKRARLSAKPLMT
jgi:transposase